jgi:hypothetical protein
MLTATPELKTCRDCGEAKARNEFHKHARTKDRLQLYCKSCMTDRNRKWRAQNPERLAKYEQTRPQRSPDERRRMQLWREYKMLPADYDRMHAEQDGKCAICGSTDPGAGRAMLAVDHDHTTGAIRGLLCNGCNVALGHLKDDVSRLRSAIDYLNRKGTS